MLHQRDADEVGPLGRRVFSELFALQDVLLLELRDLVEPAHHVLLVQLSQLPVGEESSVVG